MLITENPDIILRRLVEADKTELARLANNKKISDNLRDMFPHPYTEADAEWFINKCAAEEPALNFAIEYRGMLAGVIGLIPQADINRYSAETGYWLGEEFWGKGIAPAALRGLVNYAFNQLGLARLYACTFDRNRASQRVLEKAGFTLAAIFKNAIVKNGCLMDEHHFEKHNPFFVLK